MILAGRAGIAIGGKGPNLGKSGSAIAGAAPRGIDCVVGAVPGLVDDVGGGVVAGKPDAVVGSLIGIDVAVAARGVQVGRGVGVASVASHATDRMAASAKMAIKPCRAEYILSHLV